MDPAVKLAVSTIAWWAADEDRVLDLLVAAGIAGIEVAPTTLWPDPITVDERTVRRWADRVRARGLEVVALQSLLYGHPEFQLFGVAALRLAMLEHLGRIIQLGGWLGAGPLVFGSPRNRIAGALDRAACERIAVPFFRAAAERARQAGTTLCIEPNPSAYGCDWIRTLAEGVALVSAVDHPGFGLHVDAAAMTLSNEPSSTLATLPPGMPAHFHASEAHLAPLGSAPEGSPSAPHPDLAAALRKRGYEGWVSLEMRRPEGPDPVEILAASVARLGTWYGAGEPG